MSWHCTGPGRGAFPGVGGLTIRSTMPCAVARKVALSAPVGAPVPPRALTILSSRAATKRGPSTIDRKSTRLNSQSPCNLVCRLLLEKKKTKRPEATSHRQPRRQDLAEPTEPRRAEPARDGRCSVLLHILLRTCLLDLVSIPIDALH